MENLAVCKGLRNQLSMIFSWSFIRSLTGVTVVSRWPTSTTRPLRRPAAIRARTGAEAKLSDGTCR
jgi:hypothetical protein